MSGAFNETLRKLRKKAGLTQEELAYKVEVSTMTIRRWEWGERQPRIEDVKRLAEILKASESELLNGSDASSGWVLHVKIAQDLEEGEIDLTKGIPRKCSIITTNEGGFLVLGGSYDLWTDDNNFKKFVADLKKFRGVVIQNGIATGGIKKE